MHINLSFNVNNSIYLKDPSGSVLGKQLVSVAMKLINELGFENFTFKKLAIEVGSTEASIYRYFENKHRLLLYIVNWYWNFMEYLIDFNTQNLVDPKAKLKIVICLLSEKTNTNANLTDYDLSILHQIVIAESSKVYLVKEINEINKQEVFKPYKDLCQKIALIIKAYKPNYKYPKSLSSTLIETAHQQQFFSAHLLRLTDASLKTKNYTKTFLDDMVFSILK